MRVTFRPLPMWPYPETVPRASAKFKVRRENAAGEKYTTRTPWDKTLWDLTYEIGRLDGDDVLIGGGWYPSEIRKDGLPRADARPAHPGVEVSFDSRYGRLTYATDQYTDWRDNLRAIAASLEALRAVDRHGVSKRGQQYAGFLQLAPGGPDATRGARLVAEHGTVRAALMATHPDHGGDPRDLADVQAFREREGGLR